MAPDGDILTVRQVAALFHVDADTITRWARAGRFPPGAIFRTPGGHRRYYADKILEWRAALGYRDETVAGR